MTSYSQFSINLGFVKVKKGDFMIECIRTTASVKHARSSKSATSKQDVKGKQIAVHTVKSK